MQTVALHTRLRRGCEHRYEVAHAAIPDELKRLIEANGVSTWRIWRSGLDLFHLIEVEDFEAFEDALATTSANRDWQIEMAPMFARDQPAPRFPKLVWSLTGQS